jgi:biotin carboxyl carrier protein
MALRKFKIKLEGKIYEAEVEEIIDGESQSFSDIKKEPVVQPVSTTNQNRTISAGSSKTVVAPMPGKIISIKCAVGQPVKAGEVLLILEAMKMEQEIKTKVDGIISEIKVAAGMTVQKEDILIIIS